MTSLLGRNWAGVICLNIRVGPTTAGGQLSVASWRNLEAMREGYTVKTVVPMTPSLTIYTFFQQATVEIAHLVLGLWGPQEGQIRPLLGTKELDTAAAPEA